MRTFSKFVSAIILLFAVSISNERVIAQTSGANQKISSSSPDLKKQLDKYNVLWDVPGPTSLQSMPIGNGDIGLNVWVKKSGDLIFYIGKTDTWNSDVFGSAGLMKIGAVRVSFSPNPLERSADFVQVLKLHESEIVINEGQGNDMIKMRVWVDANNPVIRVEAKSAKPVNIKVIMNDWRLNNGDTVSSTPGQIRWYHRNSSTANAHVANLTFGAVIKGSGLKSKDDTTLVSNRVTTQLISVYPLTAQTATVAQWETKLQSQITGIEKLSLEKTRQAHQRWWDKFWRRSWVFINGDQSANDVTKGYMLQRFVTACAGRGAYPIKFNGSIFTVDNPELTEVGENNQRPEKVNADFRTWGGQYWFQNTRAMYWPRLEAGDFEEMMPLFKMYANILPGNARQVKKYYHHDGAYFAETDPFWGGLKYWGPEVKEDWTGHYFTPILEISMMMLDYYEYTGDKKFARNTLVPVATAGLEFFDKHFTRDSTGKLSLDPDNSIEQFWKVHNPAPDIAGLHALTARMLALSHDLTNKQSRDKWKKLQSELPDLPIGQRNGVSVLLPYTGEQNAKPRNSENPELYAVYPFRLYGLNKSGLQLAINTFNERKQRQKGCWVQDPIEAAMLGLTDIAKTYVQFNFRRKDPQFKFPAFWQEANDYVPDEDNGGNGENGLQQMLMQTDGKKIMLLPAWPKEWGNVKFKLHAPYNTTVEGRIKAGKLTDLIVIPASRKADVVDMSTVVQAN